MRGLGKLKNKPEIDPDIRTWKDFEVRILCVDEAKEKYIEERKSYAANELHAASLARAKATGSVLAVIGIREISEKDRLERA